MRTPIPASPPSQYENGRLAPPVLIQTSVWRQTDSAVRTFAPPGSFVNVSYPASCVGGNSDTHPTTVDILLKAFSQFVWQQLFSSLDARCLWCAS